MYLAFSSRKRHRTANRAALKSFQLFTFFSVENIFMKNLNRNSEFQLGIIECRQSILETDHDLQPIGNRVAVPGCLPCSTSLIHFSIFNKFETCEIFFLPALLMPLGEINLVCHQVHALQPPIRWWSFTVLGASHCCEWRASKHKRRSSAVQVGVSLTGFVGRLTGNR